MSKLTQEGLIKGARYWVDCCPASSITSGNFCPRKECPFESYDECNQAYHRLKEIVKEYFKPLNLVKEAEKRGCVLISKDYEGLLGYIIKSGQTTIEGLMKQQKPTVTEKEIESAIFAGRNWDDGKFYDKDGIQAVIELLVSKGFKVLVK